MNRPSSLGILAEYTPRERFWLWTVAVVGAVGLNGAFVYGVFFQPGALAEAMANPVSLAFMAEAWVLVGLLAYLLTRWGVGRLGWGWFVLLSFLGGIAFALPVVLLWPGKKASTGPEGAPAERHGAAV